MASSTNTAPPKPIYRVDPTGSTPRLIRAPNRVQVMRHLARDYEIEIASQDDLVELLGAGTKVEEAGDDAPAPTDSSQQTGQAAA